MLDRLVKTSKNHRGGALIFALVALIIISVIMAIGAKSSTSITSLMSLTSMSTRQEIQVKDHFLNAQQAIVNQTNLWMRVRRVCDAICSPAMGCDPESYCTDSAQLDGPLNFIPTAYRIPSYIIAAVQSPGSIPEEAIRQSYHQIEGEKINWRSMCMTNCNTETIYPKRFMLEIETIDPRDPSVSVRASGMIDIDRAALSDFSNLALGISGSYFDTDSSDWTSFPEVPMSAGTHGRIGYFFDTESLNAYATEWSAHHGGQTIPSDLLGVIRFLNPPDQALNIRKLHTNLPVSNIYYGDYRDDQHQIPNGPVSIQEGIVTATSPSSEVHVNFQELAQAEETIKSTSSSGCNVYSPQVWKRPYRAELRMSCNAGSQNCSMVFQEWRKESEAPDAADVPCTPLHSGAEIPANSTFYTTAGSVKVLPNGGESVVGFGTHNFTVIANGSFEPTHSIQNIIVPSPESQNQGNLAFVSLQDDAIKLKPEFETNLAGNPTLLELYNRSSIPEPSDVSVRLQVAAITSAEKKAPYKIDSALMGDSFESRHLGKLVTEGAAWGSNPSTFRKLNANGEVVTGFAQVETNYPTDAIRNPPPGLNIRTSSLHTSTVSGFTITREKLKNTMAEFGVEWRE